MYLKDSNAASHFVNSLILFALSTFSSPEPPFFLVTWSAKRHFKMSSTGDEDALSRPGILFAYAPQKNVGNRWYTSSLRVCKSQNGSGFNKFSAMFPFVTCVKESENQSNGFVESRRKSQPSPFQKVKA